MNESNVDFKNSLNQLRRIVDNIDTFTNTNQCFDFLTQLGDEKVFMIVSGTLGQLIVPIIHHMSHLNSIYIFCENQLKHEQWANEWTKMKGVFSQIDNLCDILITDIRQCDRDSISISVTSDDLNRLDPSFMYTQLLKKLFLEMEYNDDVKKEFIDFCREQYRDNPYELQIIDEFEHDCGTHTPIWWYTRECFIYKMLNRALRIQDVEIIIMMSYFIRDVHRHIQEIHSQTIHQDSFTVYRGQGMLLEDFDRIKMSKGRLLAFNNFLSTSLNREVSLSFAKTSLQKFDLVGILFEMTITPSIPSTPFASVSDISAFASEQEILFSMHAVFRICEINQIEDRLWRIELILTSDNDQELKLLTEHIEQEIQASTGYHRLGELLLRMGNFEDAEEAFEKLLDETSNDDVENLAYIYNQLGRIKNIKGQYQAALEFYKKQLEIQQKLLLPNHRNFTATYNDIGDVYANMGEYSKALEFYQKSLENAQKYLSPDHPALGATYNNIGEVYENIGDYSYALEFHEKSLEIQQKCLPPNHPELGATYNNIGEVYANMGQYSKALECYQKSQEIQQKSLLQNHPELATTYHNSAAV
ncbi:unnamed protein product [Rotaria sordida]|uniref:Kinesin light chain n=1 Tax=Rotaria sordida TaxID=392033 RepID=A0A813VGA2_9BILA|nr:unnamed protein product [Rotaria sordida]